MLFLMHVLRNTPAGINARTGYTTSLCELIRSGSIQLVDQLLQIYSISSPYTSESLDSDRYRYSFSPLYDVNIVVNLKQSKNVKNYLNV